MIVNATFRVDDDWPSEEADTKFAVQEVFHDEDWDIIAMEFTDE